MNAILSTFWIFIIVCVFLGAFFSLLNDKKLNLDEKSLDKQGVFWFAVISPIVLFLVFGTFIWKDYIPRLDRKGLDTFFEISKFPLSILALSPVLGVIVSNIHRTIQTHAQIEKTEIQIKNTEKQIELALTKNNMDAFYAHNKYLIEGLGEIKEHNHYNANDTSLLKDIISVENDLNKYNFDETIVISHGRKLFSEIYSRHENLKYNFNPKLSDDFLRELNNNIEDMTKILKSFNLSFSTENKKITLVKSKENDYSSLFIELKSQINKIKGILHLNNYLSLDYFDDYIASTDFYFIFYKKNNDIDTVNYEQSLIKFIVFCEMTYKYLTSISNIIGKIVDLLFNDPVYNVYDDFELSNIFFDNSFYWHDTNLCNIPIDFLEAFLEC
ncbi:hypothetical protein HGO23_04720 [Xenorhabdus budapestensis]|uniref:Phage abortive infection protein n=1 Tax=Xenorhabdus budapestensis TaxID=290110 RepID=A0ABX7VQ73_XENBU|nr:hypothetical protein [Xenorhabdus budapestensis]QTL40684.1 hypothetical protein HGO23_04720 [Xenorhabdus budapestensis]